MKMNEKMVMYLDELASRKDETVKLNEQLIKFIDDGFVREQSCIFLKRLYDPSIDLTGFLDKTGCECFVNHIHVDDYVAVDESKLVTSLLCQAILYAQYLKGKLKDVFPGEKFQIIVSFYDRDCTVRFHRIRRGEAWLLDDLSGYEEGVLVFDTKDEDAAAAACEE